MNADKMVEIIKDAGGEWVKGSELTEKTGQKKSTVQYAMKQVMEQDPRIQAERGHGYRWVEIEGKKLAEQMMSSHDEPDRYGAGKTDEGYPDPTAATAISGSPKDIRPGDIWDTSTPLGEKKMSLVVAEYAGSVTILEIRKYDKYYDQATDVRFCMSDGETYYVKPRRPVTLPASRCKAGKATLRDKIFERIREEMGAYLGCFVEKVVEKVVEKPVEHAKIIYNLAEQPAEVVREENADMLLLRQRAELWENAFYAVCGRGKV